MKQKNIDWEGLCTYIVQNRKLPSTKEAEEKYGVPFSIWFELSTRETEQLVRNSKRVLNRLEGR